MPMGFVDLDEPAAQASSLYKLELSKSLTGGPPCAPPARFLVPDYYLEFYELFAVIKVVKKYMYYGYVITKFFCFSFLSVPLLF